MEVIGFRRAKPKGKKALSLANLPANHKHYRIEGKACFCETCGTHMTEIGSTIVREEPFFIPAHVKKIFSTNMLINVVVAKSIVKQQLS